MKKSEIFPVVLTLVANEVELSADTILSKNKNTDVVDARHLLIVLLSRSGLYCQTIANMIKCSPRSIQYTISNFDDRVRYNTPLKYSYQRTIRKLQEILSNETDN